VPLLGIAALQTVLHVAAQDWGFKVVVNTANPLDSLPRTQVSRLFLKSDPTWPNGQGVVPLDLGKRSEVRASFSRANHGREVTAIGSYWQTMFYSGSAVPPTELASEDAVLAFVHANPWAVGYVSSGTLLPSDVKVL
jgi:hypothetical protein